MEKETITVEIEELSAHLNQTVCLKGSIYKIRRMSGFAFVILRGKRSTVQGILSSEWCACSLEELKEQSWVSLIGEVVPEERAKCGYEVRIREIKVLSQPSEEMPVVINQKTIPVNMETLFQYRPITLRNEKERAIFKIQEGLVRGIREFLEEEHFTEIHTPKIVAEGAEGGADIFHLDYFGKEAYLAQSPQFYKQMMVGVFERVFEIAPVYRAERHDTSRHLNEYTGVDFEMGFIESFEEIMQMETELLKRAFGFLRKNCERELELLKVEVPNIEKIPSISFQKAKELMNQVYHRSISDWSDLDPEEEKLISEWAKQTYNSEFIFITHYPSQKRPFYAMETKENPNVTESFDLIFRGLEVTTGGQRIHSYEEQAAKMERLGMKVENFESYLMIHRYGMPPHGGMGLGLERLTSRLLLQANVRYSSLFPRDIHRLIP